MNLLILDAETTGLVPGEDKVIELGMVLYNVESQRIIETQGFLIHREGLGVPGFITKINGLTTEVLKSGLDVNGTVYRLQSLMLESTYIVGHNINEFDLPHLKALAQEVGEELPARPTIDTRTDLPLKEKPTSFSLRNLLLDHEMINYFPHGAVTDSLMTLKLLTKYDIMEVIERSKVPTIKVQAVVSFADKDKAKNRGFHWQANEKQWTTTMKEDLYKPNEFDFKTRVL